MLPCCRLTSTSSRGGGPPSFSGRTSSCLLLFGDVLDCHPLADWKCTEGFLAELFGSIEKADACEQLVTISWSGEAVRLMREQPGKSAARHWPFSRLTWSARTAEQFWLTGTWQMHVLAAIISSSWLHSEVWLVLKSTPASEPGPQIYLLSKYLISKCLRIMISHECNHLGCEPSANGVFCLGPASTLNGLREVDYKFRNRMFSRGADSMEDGEFGPRP